MLKDCQMIYFGHISEVIFMNKKLNEQISDIKEDVHDLIHGVEEEG